MKEYERWVQGRQVQQAQQAAERQAAIEQARKVWVGCRVWHASRTSQGYAWVTGIDDHGFVGLHLEDVAFGYPDRVAMVFEALGVFITHEDEVHG